MVLINPKINYRYFITMNYSIAVIDLKHHNNLSLLYDYFNYNMEYHYSNCFINPLLLHFILFQMFPYYHITLLHITKHNVITVINLKHHNDLSSLYDYFNYNME